MDKVFTSMGLENCTIAAEGNETVVQMVNFQGDLTSCDEIKTSIVVTIALLSGIVMVSGAWSLCMYTSRRCCATYMPTLCPF